MCGSPKAPLAASQRIVRYDRRGFGLSTGRPSLMDDVVDLFTLLGALEVENPLLVGMSQGARVVLEFAARHPGVARGLVLDGAPPLARCRSADDIVPRPGRAQRRRCVPRGLAGAPAHATGD